MKDTFQITQKTVRSHAPLARTARSDGTNETLRHAQGEVSVGRVPTECRKARRRNPTSEVNMNVGFFGRPVLARLSPNPTYKTRDALRLRSVRRHKNDVEAREDCFAAAKTSRLATTKRVAEASLVGQNRFWFCHLLARIGRTASQSLGFCPTFVLAMLLSINIHAASLSRVVVDPQKHPLPSVSVVTNLSGIGTQTDVSGQFTLAENSEIAWVTLSCVGFLPRQFSVNSVPDTVVLEPTVIPGGDVIVRSDRAKQGESPMAFENFSKSDIDRDYKIGEFPLLLESTPNFYAFSDGGSALGYSYIKIRGFDDKRVAVYINGVPLNDPEDQATYFVDLPDFASNVTDIQIQRGVGNSLYGDASFGGSVNIATNAFVRARSLTLSSGYGRYTVSGHAEGDLSKQSINYSSGLVDGRWVYGGRFSRQSSGGYRYGSWYEGWSYYLSAARFDRDMTTELHLYGGPMRMHLSYNGETLDAIKADRRANQLTYSNETDNFNQPHYQLHNVWTINPRTTLSHTLYYIRGKGYYEQLKDDRYFSDYNIAPEFIDDSATGVKYQTGDLVRQQWVYKTQIGWNPRLDIEHERGSHGIGGSFYGFRSDHWGQVVWGEHLSNGLDPRLKYHEYHGTKYVGSLYAQEIYNLTPKLSTQVTAQVRYQNYKFRQDKLGAFKGYDYDLDWLFFSPRVGFTYKIDDQAAVFTNFAVSSRTPTDADIYDAGDPEAFPSLKVIDTRLSTSGDTTYKFGDPTAESERVYDFELGGSCRKAKWSAGVNLFWMEFRNEIIPYGGVNSNNGLPITVNADRSVHAGVELTGSVKLTPQFTVSANGAFNRNRIKSFIASVPLYDGNFIEIGRMNEDFADKVIPGYPTTIGNLLADYKTDRFRLTYRLRLVGSQYMELRNLDSLQLKGYGYSTISAECGIGKLSGIGKLLLSLRVDNLENRKFLTSGYGWNDFYQPAPSGPVYNDDGAEYYVGAERSFYAEVKLEMF